MEALRPRYLQDVEDLYRAEGQKMWRALLGFSGSREIADDAVSEAFTRALAIGASGSIKNLSAWTWRVAFRVAVAELARKAPPPEGAGDQKGPSPTVPDLVRALRKVSNNQRMALVLHDYADRSTAEVADILGCSRGTVLVHLSVGRRRLRSLLEETDA
jgi:RNA polymerase sigma-70 factor (ECF subfamily)